MAQQFFINKKSLLPRLMIELGNEGYYDKDKFYEAIQDAVITFSMRNIENGVLMISDAEAKLMKTSDECGDSFVICYEWKPRDVKNVGTYDGKFKIKFNENITQNNVDYPNGELIVPIKDDITIVVR